ncbi:LysM peptidoglycan-binding domain-containing protein [Paenibacillus tuaregi]|uniref:LysM peptidoglycan-binding domain-containing protein n=1 Tax=Paenibacillus tuaregi TaxID=1816681 RepID=UPI000838745F|nr:LysM domain-containing protein [Paenibacillus tuaregi]
MKIHIVQQGDTLFELSKKYDVPLQKLIDANPQLANPDQLNIGDKVKVPTVGVPIGNQGGSNVIYKHEVKEGDTLWKLSKAWGIPLDSIISANPQLANPDDLKVGDIVNIPSAGKANTTAPQAGSGSMGTGDKAHTAPIISEGKKSTAPIEGGKKNTAPIEQVPVPEVPTPLPAPAPAPVVPPVIEIQPAPPAPQPIIPQYNIEVEYSEISAPNYVFEFQQPPVYQYVPEYQPQPEPYVPEYKPEPIKESPCGCGSSSHHLFKQYPVEAEKVSGLYDYAPMTEQPFQSYQPQGHYQAENPSFLGEYPGISAAPIYEWPQVYPPVEPCPPAWPYHHGMHHAPYGYGPEQNIGGAQYSPQGSPWGMEYSQTPYQHPYPCAPYGAFHSVQPQPYGYSTPVEPYGGYELPPQPSVPHYPLGGFGVSDVIREEREDIASEDTPVIQGFEGQDSEADIQEGAKRETRKEGKKARTSNSSPAKKEREKASSKPATKNKDTRQNPWINE